MSSFVFILSKSNLTHKILPFNSSPYAYLLDMTGFKLFDDESFHFETLRMLGASTANGADISEVLMTIPKIKAGDFDSWARAWYDLGTRVEAQAKRSDPSTASGRVSARNAYFRAASYYRSADFYLHGNPVDPRIMDFWAKYQAAFDAAIALLPSPGRRIEIPTPHGFHVPAIFYEVPGSAGDVALRPTLLLGNGFDGSQEEMYHVIGAAALERGFNVISYEGPGQPAVRRYQGRGFIPEWEKVVTPVVDYLHSHASELHVDVAKLGLWGYSMGGMLGLRAVAFEKRIQAFIACDGVWNTSSAVPAAVTSQIEAGNSEKLLEGIANGSAPTGLRWLVTHGLWAMFDGERNRALEATPDLKELVDVLGRFNVEDTVGMVDCKVLVAEAEDDVFFQGQPKLVADALGNRATYHVFKTEDGAGEHCHMGAAQLLSQVTLDWLETALSN
ncbi:hypothetical protein SLS58_004425 [Diplodia intermedia]|uniref:AB hydrolase-1 domain-containing protein n=1 Tax=Diplodia intermedia TaxID=856260 RepID=A0ABR3TU73_9PEZI